jgi:mRNA interferase MazF
MMTSVAGPAVHRGDIWWIDFDGSVGGEIRKTRPAVIVSNDHANGLLNRVQVVPVSSQVARIYPSEALIRIEGRTCKAMADQIATADKTRLRNRIARVTRNELKAIEAAIRVQLALK